MRTAVKALLLLIPFLGAALMVGVLYLYNFLTVFQTTPPEGELAPSLKQTLISHEPLNRDLWEVQKPYIQSLFEEEVYGSFPKTTISWTQEHRTLDNTGFNGKGVVEEIILKDTTGALRIPVVLVTPIGKPNAPLLIASSFCANHTAFPEYDVEKPSSYPGLCDNKESEPLKHFILGRYIETYPVEQLLDQGYAFASFYTGSIAPDNESGAQIALATLSSFSETPVTGVISAWAWGYIQVMHALEIDPRIDSNRVALYGHSRDGKAALLAGAFDESVDAVIAHQSGTGGAAPSQRSVGESIGSIMKNYPYWFDHTYLTYAGRETELVVDQQFLIALMAPRPLLLTGARQDKWADPIGAFMAERDASFVYNLYSDRPSFTAKKITNFIPTDSLVFFMRSLNHGARVQDWDAFTIFLNAHFK